MLYTRIRLFLIFFFLGVGILLHIRVCFNGAWYLYAGALLLLITHFLFGPVWMAFRLLSRGRTEEAERVLDSIRRPDWLIRRNRAYYHFSRGLLHLQRKELAEGEAQLYRALDAGLTRPNDRALAHLNLAHIAFVQERYDVARRQLERSREEEVSDLMLKDKQQELEQALQRVG